MLKPVIEVDLSAREMSDDRYLEYRASKDELNKPVQTDLLCQFLSCSQTFKSFPCLSMHLEQVHKVKPANDSSRIKANLDGKTRFFCPIGNCKYHTSRWFAKYTYLKQHYRKCHTEKQFKCQKCQKAFVQLAQLSRHEPMCGKVYKCMSCDTPYSTKEALQTHQTRNKNCWLNLSSLEQEQRFSITEIDSSITQNLHLATQQSTNNQSSIVTQPFATPHSDHLNYEPSVTVLPNTTVVILNNKAENPKHKLSDSSTDSQLKAKYVKIAPRLISTATQATQRQSNLHESCSTQTDILKEAMMGSNLNLNPISQTTMTNISTMMANDTSISTQTPSLLMESQQGFDRLNAVQEFGTQTHEFSQPSAPQFYNMMPTTQTSASQFVHHEVPQASWHYTAAQVVHSSSYTELGTQTDISSMLENLEDPHHGMLTDSRDQFSMVASHYNESFQTQTSFHASNPDSEAQTTTTGTQTSQLTTLHTLENTLTVDTTDGSNYDNMPACSSSNSNSAMNSTSDFSMQFPFELMNFGTQTILERNEFDNLLSEALDDIQTSQVYLSQSSTQTDLDFLFSNNQTQTDINLM